MRLVQCFRLMASSPTFASDRERAGGQVYAANAEFATRSRDFHFRNTVEVEVEISKGDISTHKPKRATLPRLLSPPTLIFVYIRAV
jgi:hypothetical protein